MPCVPFILEMCVLEPFTPVIFTNQANQANKMKATFILKQVGLWLLPFLLPVTANAANNYVDLGLPSGTLWAECNVGATTPEGYGDFYAWGETKTKTSYSWTNYQYASGSASTAQDLGMHIAGTMYDTATAVWGSEWVMPTLDQANELLKKCSVSLATVNNVKGMRFKGPNGNTIFFPMAGYKYNSNYNAEGSQVYIWTDTKDNVTNEAYKSMAIYIYRSSTSATVKTTAAPRRSGVIVRAVRSKEVVDPDPPTPPSNGPELVDLGLSVKWCSQNVGADSESAYGEYYAWGETATKKTYSWANYQHASGSTATVRSIGTNIAGTEYDVAAKTEVYDPAANKQVEVCMPTVAQFEELNTKCSWKEETVDGHKGFRVTGPSGKSIFLPFSGSNFDGSMHNVGVYTYYWSSEEAPSDELRAGTLLVKTGETPDIRMVQKRTGLVIRAVEQTKGTEEDPVEPEQVALVDLGLSVKWCSQNLGADSESAYGEYYSWGETATKNTYTWANYQHANGSASTVKDIGSDIAGTEYDVAAKTEVYDPDTKQQVAVSIPTKAQFEELRTKCTWKEETVDGHKGYRVTGTSGKSIFLPFSGSNYDGSMHNVGIYAYYWSSEVDASYLQRANAFYIKTATSPKMSWAQRRTGLVIRAVEQAKGTEENPVEPEQASLVDLGLSVKWCSQNVGADSESAFGEYYSWGETATKATYTWANYQYANGSATTVKDIGSDIAGTEYDVAAKTEVYDPDTKQQVAVSMPTKEQFEELRTKCTWKEETVDDHKGYRVTGPSGKSIFLPFSGSNYDGSMHNVGVYTYYWSSEVDASNLQKASALYIKTATAPTITVAQRRTGLVIRAVEYVEGTEEGNDDPKISLVDLGLSVKWADMNVGATEESGYGDFYAWGETATKTTYTWANYQHANGSAATVKDIGSDITGTEYDVAAKTGVYDPDVKKQVEASLPTMEQFEELRTKCTWKEETIDGHKGFRATGPNGKSIFLPLSGCSYDGKEYSRNVSCNYWTSEVNASDAQRANVLYIKTANAPKLYVAQRRTGAFVRPVEKVEVEIPPTPPTPPGTDAPYAILSSTTLTFYYDSNRASRSGTAYDLNTGKNAPKWQTKASSVKKVVFDASFKEARPTSCHQWFYGMSALTTITGLANLNTSEATSMQGMFTYCSTLTSLDLTHFNTANVTDMSAMFYYCSNLESVDVSQFNTEKVTHMGLMFAFSGLEELDISNFVIPDSTKSSGKSTLNMIGACTNLQHLVIPASAVKLKSNACELVGADTPCSITAPEGFKFGVSTSGSSFKWKGGRFKIAGTSNPDPDPDPDPDPNIGEHEYVDLGLPSGTLWATCNVGADAPEEYGDFYAWGETATKPTYSWSNYLYASGSSSTVQDIGENIAGTEYDVAATLWGSEWVMPTLDQANELLRKCSASLATVNNVKGLRFKGPNGNTIFFPMTGYKYDSNYSNEGLQTYLWLSNNDNVTNVAYKAMSIHIKRSTSSASVKTTAAPRRSGVVVRAVRAGTGSTNDFNFDTDGIFSVTTNASSPSDDATYTLQGIKVEGQLKPGIYIRNGKKFTVK